SRLPGMDYRGDDPDGYMSMPQVVDLIAGYADIVAAPVRTSTTVTRVTVTGTGYEVATDRGDWRCATVVVASGSANVANVPAVAAAVPPSIASLTAMSYRSPDQLDDRGVLVVGASATGVQLADEVHRSGRPVTIAVGEHVRLPRLYRGRDIFWWMDAEGVLDERYDEIDDLVRARHLPSPQLIGSPERRSIDLNSLAATGVGIVGRLGRISDGVAQFSGALANICTLADLKLGRLLTRFDDWVNATGAADVNGPNHPEPTSIPPRPPLELDLLRHDIGTIIWATGYRPDHSWLDVPVLDHKGRIRHEGGVVRDAPGMYLLGANVLRRRSSSFIHGAERDSADLSAHLHDHLDARAGPSRRDLGRRPVSA
ncbi:MAG TPA: NAD(P)-binding domain-containing protein, partial [Nitriliruptorales bacterium]